MAVALSSPPKRTEGRSPEAEPTFCEMRVIMDESVQKSCWGVAAKAVAGFAIIILVAWLVGGAETATVAVAG